MAGERVTAEAEAATTEPRTAAPSPAAAGPAAVQALQRSVGNRAMSALAAGARGGEQRRLQRLEGTTPWVLWNAEQQAHWIEDRERLPPNWRWEGPAASAVPGPTP
jgi:hypothetical protein